MRHRLKSSFVYDLIGNREAIRTRRDEVAFYRRLLTGLPSAGLIFDIGANDGTKTDVFLRLGAKVVVAEPDEKNQLILRERFLRYRAFPKPVTVIGKAVSAQEGNQTLWMDGPGSALNTLSHKWVETLQENKARFVHTHGTLEFAQSRKVETTTIERLIEAHGVPYFIKIDVEGHESEALRGLRRPVPFLSFEVNLPEFRFEGIECVRLLEALGDGQFNYATELRQGLVLKEFVAANEIRGVLARSAGSVEVFWRSRR